MSGFSEAAMSKRLESLSATLQSIQTVSLWLLHHQKRHSEIIVQLWLKEIKKEIRPNRLVNLLYLANDVIQNSRKQCPEFMDLFYTVLEPAFKHLSMHADSQAVSAVKKIIRVFRERQIYSSAKVDRLVSAITSSLTGALLVEFNTDLSAGPDVSNRVRMTPSTPPMISKQSILNSPQTSLASDDGSPESKKSKISIEKLDLNQMSQTTRDLVNILKKLEDPPSADAATRQRIATFPESIANLSVLKQIKNEKQAREMLAKIDEASPVVKKYCERLTEEVEDRRNVQRLLSEFYEYLKASNARNNEMLTAVSEKIEKLNQEKAAVDQHLQSLPDLTQLPVDAFNPLPTLGELFKGSAS